MMKKEKKELLKHIDAGNYNAAKRIIDNIKELRAIERLEHIRQQIEAECISTAEICELQALAKYIEKDDVELLQWAGVEEFKG